MKDADYANYLEFLTNTPTQIESLLHNIELAARGKAKFVSFEQDGAISTFRDKPLK